MAFDHFLRNGEILPVSQAVVPLASIEYAYGFGVYETIRVAHGKAYFLDEHLHRLFRSAEIIGVEHSFTAPAIKKGIGELMAKTEAQAYNIKLLLVGGAGKDEASLFGLCSNPLFPDKKLYIEGASAITYEYERPWPHAKSLNMLPSFLAYKKAKEAGAYDALLVNHGGYITEGTRTNFFCIRGRTIYTPPEKEILLGVTRKMLIRVAELNGYEIKEENIKPEDVKNYDNAFISSTSSRVMPLRRIDSQELPLPGEDLKNLMRLFDEFLAQT